MEIFNIFYNYFSRWFFKFKYDGYLIKKEDKIYNESMMELYEKLKY